MTHEIRPYDAVGRYLIESDTHAGVEYLVCLHSWNLFGECSCEHFKFRLLPDLQKGITPRARCKHIVAVREFFTDEALRAMERIAHAG